ncbi:hypothetical protein [Prevotella sp. HUN102]|uniref:hypothetical protein n=1 Tax=Prevotella sp. HUN102 TaxID=1392486 RepID=UPI00048D59A4|nr:hypothetical protein [Prevotella sp. HUN102]
MITEHFIRNKFISEALHKGIHKVYSIQEQVVRSNYQLHTGRLLTSLSSHNFTSSSQGYTQTFYIRILPYLRFLDMAYRLRKDRIAKHRRAKFALYNRVVWGVLYHETFPEITYGFTDEVRKQIGNDLKGIFNTDIKSYFKAD